MQIQNDVGTVAQYASEGDIHYTNWLKWPSFSTLNLGAVEAQNVAIEERGGPQWRGKLKMDRGGFVDQWSQICLTLMGARIQISIKVKRRIRIRIREFWICNNVISPI
jgi:hypothetical protein